MQGRFYLFWLLAVGLSMLIPDRLSAEDQSDYERNQKAFIQSAGLSSVQDYQQFRANFAGGYAHQDNLGLRIFRIPIGSSKLDTLEIATTDFTKPGPFKILISTADSFQGTPWGQGMLWHLSNPPKFEPAHPLVRKQNGLQNRKVSFPIRYEDFESFPVDSNMIRVRELLFPKGRTREPVLLNLDFATQRNANPSLSVWVDDPSQNFQRASQVQGSTQNLLLTSGGGTLVDRYKGTPFRSSRAEAPPVSKTNEADLEEIRSRELHRALLLEAFGAKETDQKELSFKKRSELWNAVRAISLMKANKSSLSFDIGNAVHACEALLEQSPANAHETQILKYLADIKHPEKLPRDFWLEALNVFGVVLSKSKGRAWSPELFNSERRGTEEFGGLGPSISRYPGDTPKVLKQLLNDTNTDVSAAAEFLYIMDVKDSAAVARVVHRLASTPPFLRGSKAREIIEKLISESPPGAIEVPRGTKTAFRERIGTEPSNSDFLRDIKVAILSSLRKSPLTLSEYFSLMRTFANRPDTREGTYEYLPAAALELLRNEERRKTFNADFANAFLQLGVGQVNCPFATLLGSVWAVVP